MAALRYELAGLGLPADAGGERFLLAVGTFDPRKRVGLLADVLHRVRAEAPITLVIAGDQGAFTARVSNAFAETAAGDSVRIIGHVDDATLAALYTGAECLVFTSAYEGFGLPPVEAMACGTAAVVFDNSSLPEVAGAAAITVPDGDTGAMAAAIVRLLHEPDERARRSDEGRAWASQFTWRRAAEATLTVYERVLPPAQRRPV